MKQKELTDEELWELAGSGKPITREMLGLLSNNRKDGHIILTEGFEITNFSFKSFVWKIVKFVFGIYFIVLILFLLISR